MPRFSAHPVGVGAPWTNNTDPTSTNNAILLPLGTKVIALDGSAYRWCKAGAVDTVVGKLYQSAAQITNHQNCSVTATAVGGLVVNVTPGATAGAANLYAEGRMIVSTTPGVGYAYSIASHPAITSATAFNLTLDYEDPIQVALTTSSKVDLQANPYQNVIVSPTTVTGVAVGWSVYIITAAYNGWLQVDGVVAGLVNGTPAVGQMVIPSATTAGAVDIQSGTGQVVGSMLVTGVSTRYQAIKALIG